jgi:hypothetical protein
VAALLVLHLLLAVLCLTPAHQSSVKLARLWQLQRWVGKLLVGKIAMQLVCYVEEVWVMP